VTVERKNGSERTLGVRLEYLDLSHQLLGCYEAPVENHLILRCPNARGDTI
jgi:hypothetical protein